MHVADERSRLLLDAMPVPVAQCSADGRIVHANPAFERLLGCQPEGHRIHGYLAAGEGAQDPGSAAGGRATHVLASTGGPVPVTMRVVPLPPDAGASEATQLVLIEDMRPFDEAIRRLERHAYSDALTELANRRALDERLASELARAARYGRPLSVLALDLDQFKRINDVWGHPAGDRALRAVADVLRATLRSTDFAARAGGDEFVVLLAETALDGATAAADRISARVREQVQTGSGAPLTVTIGTASAEAGDTPESLLARADAALIEAKRLLQASLVDTGDFDRAPTTGEISRLTPRRGW